MNHRIKLLGSLAIEENGRISRIMNSTRGCALVAYLIYTDAVQSREKIADLLWEASSTRQSLSRLRELLPRLRKWMPEVQTTRQTVAFVPMADSFVDLLALRDGLAAADLSTRDEALRLYHGDFLANFHLEGAPYFNEWLLLVREQLRQQVLDAHRRLCAVYAEQKAWDLGVDVARRWLVLESLDEVAHRWLIQLLANDDQLTAARQAYQSCRQILWQELEIEPEPATTDLAQQVADRGGTAISLPELTSLEPLTAANLAEPGPLPARAILPYLRNRDFVGREVFLLRLAAILGAETADVRPPLAAITGMGGVGKTQTAVEFCYRYGRYFAGGVYWLNFAEAHNVAEEVALMGSERGLGLYREKDQLTLADRTGQVQRAWQETTPRLLIFDNCEDESLLADWLPVSGGCRVLLTCRRGQWARELGVTAVPLNSLQQTESVTLIQRLAPRIATTDAVQIAQEVGHLPLALHLAASFLNRYQQLPIATYLAQLRDENLLQHPSLRGQGTTYSPTKHELNVARTYAISLEQLDPTNDVDSMARQLLSHLICFVPGEPIPSDLLRVTILTDETDIERLLLLEDGLSRLVALGFIRIVSGDRVAVHRLVTAFTVGVMGENGEAVRAVEQTLIDKLVIFWEKELHFGTLPFAANQLRHAAERALPRQDEAAASLANHLGRHLFDILLLEEAEPYLLSALALRETLLGEVMDTAVTLTNLGALRFRQGHIAEAKSYFERAATICENVLGLEHPKTARSINNLAIIYSRQGNYTTAKNYYEKSLAIYDRILTTDDPMIPMILTNMGILFRRMGQYDASCHAIQRALALREANLGPNHLTTMDTLHTWGFTELQAGRYATAATHFERVLAVRRKALGKENGMTALTQFNLAKLHIIHGRYVEAEADLQSCLVNLKKGYGADHHSVTMVLAYLGDLVRRQGRDDEAAAYFEEMAQRLTAVSPAESPELLHLLTDWHLQQAAWAEAKATLEQSQAICEEMLDKLHPFWGQACLRLGEWHWHQGAKEVARTFFEEARAVLITAVAPTHIDFLRLQKYLV